jgi:hypothetical protein
MAVSRILSPEFLRGDDHLSHPAVAGRPIPLSRNHDATIPEDHNGPAVLPLFCLAPHGVFRASHITARAVSSYLAFSPLPALLSKNRRCLFCDTFRQHPLARTLPASSTRHAAVWCSDFPPASLAAHQRSSAIGAELSIIWNPGNQELSTNFARVVSGTGCIRAAPRGKSPDDSRR